MHSRRLFTGILLAGCAILLALVPGPANAQNDVIGVYSDSLDVGADCNIYDTSPGLITVYLYHEGTPEVLASRFKVEISGGATLTYLSEAHYVPVLAGDTQSGITMCYSTCRTTPIVVASITYVSYGTSLSCSSIDVVPHPSSTTIDVIDCLGQVGWARGGRLTINPNLGLCSFDCEYVDFGPSTGFDFCQPVGTEVTTWGAIKSLYR